MDLAALAAELTAEHPETGAYSADDATAAMELNVVNRTKNRTSMTGSEVLNAIYPTDWNGLTADQKSDVWDICHLGTLNPFGMEATLLQGIFGTSTTIATLQAARLDNVSRAVELGLGVVGEGHVAQARAL